MKKTIEKLGYKSVRKSIVKESSVTTDWGVEWSPDFIARDILQNFRDANQSDIDGIKIKTTKKNVKVEADEVFDLEKLFWLGSKKGDDDIGQYGEGFKASIVSLLKLHPEADIIASSGKEAVCITKGEKTKSGFEPLAYHFFKITDTKKSAVHILGTDAKLTDAFKNGMDHFWSPKNKLRGDEITPDYWGKELKFKVFKSKSKDGAMFYRGLLRSRIPGIPIILATNEKYKAVETKIASDRDRNIFNEKVSQAIYNAYSREVRKYKDEIPFIIDILKLCEPKWEKGAPFLSSLASAVNDSDHKGFEDLFKGKKYYAASSKHQWYNNQTDIQQMRQVEVNWQQGKYKRCPEYFKEFGLESAYSYCVEKAASSHEAERKKGISKPTKKQKEIIDFSLKVAKDISGSAKSAIEFVDAKYLILKSENLLGELVKKSEWEREKLVEVYLSESLFRGTFGLFLATLLHEHSHIVGYDGDRDFSDFLTLIMAQSIDNSDIIIKAKKKWDKIKLK